MADPMKGRQTQLANIERRTGKSLKDFATILKSSGLSKHGELRDFLKTEHGLGHGDANALVHNYLEGETSPTPPKTETSGDILGEIYVGPKEALRPIHEALMEAINGLGEFEIALKKGYVSLRRKKQFAMIGPATNTRVELGLNMKGVPATGRLLEMPPGGMCNYKVKLTKTNEVDPEVIAWVRIAFDSAG